MSFLPVLTSLNCNLHRLALIFSLLETKDGPKRSSALFRGLYCLGILAILIIISFLNLGDNSRVYH